MSEKYTHGPYEGLTKKQVQEGIYWAGLRVASMFFSMEVNGSDCAIHEFRATDFAGPVTLVVATEEAARLLKAHAYEYCENPQTITDKEVVDESERTK